MKGEWPGTEAPVRLVRSILIVDDDRNVASAMADTIGQLGHQAFVCSSAMDALTWIHNGNFDLILVDYRMPELTGLDLIAILREEGIQIPVIVMTGFPATEERISPEKMGIFAILRKPIAFESLAAALDKGLKIAAPGN